MAGSSPIDERLERAPTRRMKRRLYRAVPALSYLRNPKPSFLYTSGRANRCNPAGVSGLYFSELEETALREFRRGSAGTRGQDAPRLIFIAEVDLRKVLDLSKAEVLDALNLTPSDLSAPWRGVESLTRLQSLGRVVSTQLAISAIRYPSALAAEDATREWNLAIFPSALSLPSHLRIIGDRGETLEELPR